MVIRLPCRAIDGNGNIVTLTETHRSGVVETSNGLVEFFKLPQMHSPEGRLLTYDDGNYFDDQGHRYTVEPERTDDFHRDRNIRPSLDTRWRRT